MFITNQSWRVRGCQHLLCEQCASCGFHGDSSAPVQERLDPDDEGQSRSKGLLTLIEGKHFRNNLNVLLTNSSYS